MHGRRKRVVACASGELGTIPLTLAGHQLTLDNVVVRFTVSNLGFSDGLLGVILDEPTAVALAEAIESDIDLAAVVRQSFETTAWWNIEHDGDSWPAASACDSLSSAFEIWGVTMPLSD